MITTPGVAFLAKGVKSLGVVALPSVLVWWLLNIAGISFLPGHLVIVVFSLVPLFGIVGHLKTQILDRRNAAAMGARMAPEVQGKWIGNLDILKQLNHSFKQGYPGDGLWEFSDQLGPVFNLRVMWENLIFTTEPQHIKIILATDFNNYVKGERFQGSMASVLGSGVFNSDGDMWKFHRSMTRPFFSRERISDFELFFRHADNAVNQMKLRMRSGYAIDFQDLMSRYTLDSATEFLFGSCVHSLSATLPYPYTVTEAPNARLSSEVHAADVFAKAFAESQFIIAHRERLGWIWPLLEIFQDKTAKPMKIVNAYIDPIIKDALEKKRAPAEGKEIEEGVYDGDTVLDYLVKMTSDPIVLRDETLNILLAGRDTTASSLTIVLYFLSMYPAVTSRLREEIIAKVGDTRPTYDDIKDMKYLRAVINETLRLYPVVPFNIRETVHATTWPSPNPADKPIYIPAGTKVPYSVLMMHRRKDLWGPDADEFDPDRFLDHRLQKYLLHNSFIFLPFNAGPRICLGQQFAYNEISVMIVRLLQNFSTIALDLDAQPPASMPPDEWRKAGGRKSIEKFFPKMHLTIYANGGLWLKMQEANTVTTQESD